jgi:hypothetical protein
MHLTCKPQFLESLAPITLPLSNMVTLLSKSFKDALTIYAANHSASMLMDETLFWSSSSSMTNILNCQPSVSVDLHHFLDNAKLNPFEP